MSTSPAESEPTPPAPVPVGVGPALVSRVKGWLTVDDDLDDDRLSGIVEAVNSVVRDFPIAAKVLGTTATHWPERIVTGAVMLAARLDKRRNSPAGVESFGSLGQLYVRRNDPDVALLLGLGEHAKPAVG